jgi:hypothetical protein
MAAIRGCEFPLIAADRLVHEDWHARCLAEAEPARRIGKDTTVESFLPAFIASICAFARRTVGVVHPGREATEGGVARRWPVSL